jgi:hypothetical protein
MIEVRLFAGRRVRLIIVGILSIWGLPLGATTIYNNIDGTSGGGSISTVGGFILADHFGTDANSYSVTSITTELLLGSADNAPQFISLYTDSSGEPGTLLENLTLDTATATDTSSPFYIVTFSSPAILLSGFTNYWVTLETRSWKVTLPTNGIRVSPTVGAARSADGGSTWTNFSFALQMDVEGTPSNSNSDSAAPEPGTWSLAILAFFGGVAARGRRRPLSAR